MSDPATSDPATGLPTTDPPKQATLDLKAGGWVILLSIVLSLVAVLVLVGRGRTGTAASSFDLSTTLVPAGELVKATSPEALPPMLDPPLLGADEAQATRLPQHGKYLVPGDLVIGVRLGGEACAYPIRVLNWHEVVDHTLAGVPLAVTWAPLSGSPRVFDRRVGAETLELAASGVVLDSCPLLFDRRPPGHPRASSLWSQLQARALTGPAAREGLTLTVVPCELTSWAEWRDAHPDTRVIGPDLSRADRYRKDPYHAYTGSNVLRFPVTPPPPDVLPPKAPVVVVGAPGRHVVYPLPWLAAKVGDGGAWKASQDGVTFEVRYRADPPRAHVTLPEGSGLDVVHASWFAWYASFPEDARLAEGLKP